MPGFFKSIGNFFTGTPEKRENVSTIAPEQRRGYRQLINAGRHQGAGGAFGTAADYYRDLLGNESQDFDAFAAPQLRQYNEDILPGLSEQFAGMGSGGLSSSGFINAQVQGATDLAERLGSIRANLRQAGAQGLQNIGQQGLQNFSQNMVTRSGTPGFLSQVAPAIGMGLGAFGVGAGSNLGNAAGNWLSSGFGKTSPYGQQPQASPSGLQMPGFLQGTRYGAYGGY